MDDGCENATTGKDQSKETIRGALAALEFAEFAMKLSPDIGRQVSFQTVAKVIAALPDKSTGDVSLMEAAFGAFCRMLWIEPTCLDEIFNIPTNGGEEDKIAITINMWLEILTSIPLTIMMSRKALKLAFINQKGAALSLCSAACRSPRVARVSGVQIVSYTKKLLEVETKAEVDLDSLVEDACGITRKVVGDGPLGDISARTADMLKMDPLLTVNMSEALDSAEKA